MSVCLVFLTMYEGKDVWQSRYYRIPRMYMTWIGIWPYDTIVNRCLHFIPTFIFSFSILIPQIQYLLHGSISLNDWFDCLPSISISIVFTCKLVIMMINYKKMKACFKMIEEDWLSLGTDTEKAILQQHSEYGQYLTTSYAIFMLLTAIFYSVKPVIITLLEDDVANITKSSIAEVSKLPFFVEYGERLDQYFYVISFHCYVAICAHICTTVAVDSFYCTLVQHACGMFSVVGYVLENIGKDDNTNFYLKLDKMKDHNYMKALDCLRRHLHVVEFAELIESTFTNLFLASISMNMITCSMCGMQLIMNLSNTRDIIAPLALYIAQLIHLFIQFWQAQYLLDYSEVPYESICRAKWYYTSIRCQKILLLIMNRTMSPCKITAGKIMTLSIETFSMVLKSSMSYFTMLRTFQ